MKFNSENEMIKSTLDKAGYGFMEPTEENLRECFSDYVDCGVWADIDFTEDLNEFSVKNICHNILKLR